MGPLGGYVARRTPHAALRATALSPLCLPLEVPPSHFAPPTDRCRRWGRLGGRPGLRAQLGAARAAAAAPGTWAYPRVSESKLSTTAWRRRAGCWLEW